MEEYEVETEGDGAKGGGFSPELLRSYLAFGKRALRAHRIGAVLIFLAGAALAIAAAVFIPKTYVCKTVLIARDNTVLDRNDAPAPLSGAEGLIMRQENLEALIRDTNLIHTFEARRPALLRLKDRIMIALVGPMTEKIKVASLVGTLETKIGIETEKNELAVTVAWSDGQTAAELAEAARDSFLKARHTAEISAFEDRATILDGHASKVRDEVTALADQMNAESAGGASATVAPTAPGAAPAPRVVVTRSPAPRSVESGLVTEQLSSLKEQLAAAKPKLNELQNDWQRRQREEQGKLADLKLKFTANHPEVLTAQERLAMLSQVPADVAQARAEVAALEDDIKARELIVNHGSVASGSVVSAAAVGAGLPATIIQALEKDDVDPALKTQLSGAIVKYGELRNSILSGRIDLDTAQAAFNHRYQISMPAEVPSKPTKPKPALIVIGGLLFALLLALLFPILSELRRGVIVESWQVHDLQLPVLAELRLPPHTD
jgi:uncharacterized protein involved in exopolysaccharide biosynthesis